MRADACEMASLESSGSRARLVVAATGDDKVNLVVSASKTERWRPAWSPGSTTPRTSGCSIRWGVDVAVSTPPTFERPGRRGGSRRGPVRLMTFRQSRTNLVEMTLPHDSNVIGRAVGDVEWPVDTSLWLSCARTGSSHPPDDPLEVGDELLFVAIAEQEQALSSLLH